MKGASQIAPFGLRMPEDLKTAIAERATRNGRSMNAEIVQILQDALAEEESDSNDSKGAWENLDAQVAMAELENAERESSAEESSRRILEVMEQIIAKHLAAPSKGRGQKPLESLKANRPGKKFNREK